MASLASGDLESEIIELENRKLTAVKVWLSMD
jgi:hypothetical protein